MEVKRTDMDLSPFGAPLISPSVEAFRMAGSSQEEALRHQIEEAFGDVPYPGDDNLVSHDCPECGEIAHAFRGKHWRGLPVEFLFHYNAALSLFTPEAYRYFLPAYILVSILNYEEADIIPDYVVYGLSPKLDEGDSQYVQRRMEGFTSPQRAAIGAFLEFLKERLGAEEPLCDDINAAIQNIGTST